MMKKLFIITLLVLNTGVFAQKKEVKQTIVDFFNAFHAKDTLKMKLYCHENMLIQSVSEMKKTPVLTEEKKSVFLKNIASIPNNVIFEEKVLGYKITIDGTIATASTPYEFWVNKKLSHVGVNQFTLFYENNQWKIVHIIDTRRKKV